jgi:hypothetical protein
MAEALGLELPQAERPAPRPPVQRPVTPYQRVPAPARQGQVPRRVAPAKADAAPKPARHETVAEHHLRSRLPEQSVTPGEPPQPEPIQAATRAQQPQVIVGVDFSDLQKAREAIVYYEVLAPPKCFRRDADMWEL